MVEGGDATVSSAVSVVEVGTLALALLSWWRVVMLPLALLLAWWRVGVAALAV